MARRRRGNGDGARPQLGPVDVIRVRVGVKFARVGAWDYLLDECGRLGFSSPGELADAAGLDLDLERD